MFEFLQNLLSDRKGGEIFKLFSGWHFLYIALAAAAVIALLLVIKKKGEAAGEKSTRVLIDIAFGMYILDIFLMPIAYGEIDIEKLPFHACTAMCVMCFFSYRIKWLEKFRMSFVKLGFISNLVYLIYPAGVMWHAVHPVSYRVIQTLLFHSVMAVYGFVMLAMTSNEEEKKHYLRDLLVLVGMTVWALLGNYTYNGTAGEYSHFFNWFFVVRDPFNMLPESIAPFIMPFLNIAVFYAVEMVINLLLFLRQKAKGKTAEETADRKVRRDETAV